MGLYRFIAIVVFVGLCASQAHAQCQRGQTGVALATSCAQAVSDDARHLRWEAAATGFVQIHASQCSDFRILATQPADHLVEVECANAGMPFERVWVNQAYLSCAPSNLRQLPIGQVFSSTCAHCVSERASVARNIASTLQDAQVVNQSELAQGLIHNARVLSARVQRQASQDSLRVMGEFERIPRDRIMSDMERGLSNLMALSDASIRQYGENCDRNGPGGLSAAARVQGQRTCALLKESVQTGQRWHQQAGVARDRAIASAASNPAEANRRAQQAYSERIQSMLRGYQTSQDAIARPEFLSAMMVMFYSLPLDAQDRLVAGDSSQRLAFVRQSTESMSARDAAAVLGQGRSFYELHTGYVFGGSRLGDRSGGGLDCSDFVTQLIRGDVRGGVAPTTLDFMRIAQALGDGRQPSGRWRAIASCFDAVNVRNGQQPQAGDVVISRNATLNGSGGHIVLATGYDSRTGVVSTIEAAGGVGRRNTVSESSRPILEPACGGSPVRAVRPDIYVLRFKANPPTSCPINMNVRVEE